VNDDAIFDAVVVGAGVAGLSAGIYLGRAQRKALLVSSGNSMAVWEPVVENYLGFPDGISGEDLISRGKQQAVRYEVNFAEDLIDSVRVEKECFLVTGKHEYCARRVLLATGIYHLPPDLPGVKECLGHSMFFCKDCDGTTRPWKPNCGLWQQ
jgi:thioredoxin reductase (NADPH)